MKTFTRILLTIFLIACFSRSDGQWRQLAFGGKSVTLLQVTKSTFFAYTYEGYYTGKLYKSINDGLSWQLADSSAMTDIPIYDVTFDSIYNRYVAITEAVAGGMFYSYNGIVWTEPQNGYTGDGIAYIDSQLVMANGVDGAAISTNGGILWGNSNLGLTGHIDMHNLTRLGDTLYMSNIDTITRCFISGDGGISWQPRTDSLSYYPNCYFEHQGITYTCLNRNGVSYYQDGYWHTYDQGLPQTGNYLTLAEQKDTLFAGGDSVGVWMNNTGIWTDFSCGFPPHTTVYKLLTLHDTLFAGTDHGIWIYPLHQVCLGFYTPLLVAPDTFTVLQASVDTFDVTAVDNIPAGDSACVSLIGSPARFTVLDCHYIVYQPDSTFIGRDSFVYALCDTAGTCDTTKVVVHVNPNYSLLPVVSFDQDTTVTDPLGYHFFWTAKLFVCNHFSPECSDYRIINTSVNFDSILWCVSNSDTPNFCQDLYYRQDTIYIDPEMTCYNGRITVCLTAYNRFGRVTVCDTSCTISICEGITEVPLADIHIYPNPADKVLTIDMRRNNDVISRDYAAIYVYDDLGQRVRSIPRHDSSRLVEIPVSSLPDGIYLSTITDAQGREMILGRFTVVR